MITWYADEIVTIQFSRMPRTETLNATPNSTPEEIKDIKIEQKEEPIKQDEKEVKEEKKENEINI